MGLSRSAIEAMAPDQAALSAAAGLLKPAKWPTRARAGGLIWGECQGSGANPYRVAADTEDAGSKCTCPSRKFPCKHALALMWMFVEDESAFQAAETPDWVMDWIGRRRKGGAPAQTKSGAEPKSMAGAAQAVADAPVDPEVAAKRKAAAEKRAADTRRLVREGLDDLELWIADQFRTGLGGFVNELSERCRKIAARLVDAKAGALAGRVDEAPSRLLSLQADERIDAAIAELGKLVLLARAWRAEPEDPELRREVVASETRDDVLADPKSPRVASTWEVLGERISTRRDGLVSVATWLLNLGETGPRFALLLDFFPASAGRRSGAFAAAERMDAELAFYPSREPLRAVLVQRTEQAGSDEAPWPRALEPDPVSAFAETLLSAPWRLEAPVLLPAGRIAADASGQAWWLSDKASVPIDGPVADVALGARIDAAAGLWNGTRLSLLAARSDWGRLSF